MEHQSEFYTSFEEDCMIESEVKKREEAVKVWLRGTAKRAAKVAEKAAVVKKMNAAKAAKVAKAEVAAEENFWRVSYFLLRHIQMHAHLLS